MREYQIVSINVGKPEPITVEGKPLMSGINKQPVTSPVYLSSLNLEGDAQADLINHGGTDKAVCVYAHDHYPYWEKVLNRRLTPGAFGENLTVSGLSEEQICIGDIFRLGEAVVQVSQPRQPCYKLANKQGVADMVEMVQRTGFTGYYFRVLENGWIIPASRLQLVRRHPKKVTVAFANRIKYHDKDNAAGIRAVLEVQELSASWQESFARRLSNSAE